MLDAVGTNSRAEEQLSADPVCKRCDDIPFPEASDHRPVSLQWRSRPQKRRRRVSCDLISRPIPNWLTCDEAFVQHMDGWLNQWWHTRPRGFDGVDDFAKNVHLLAINYMKEHVIFAKTVEHRLETCVAAIQLLEAETLSEVRLSRLLAMP